MASETDPPDAELVRRYKGGDPEALRILFERYVDLVRARVRSLVPSPLRRRFSVSDVLQEARIVALQRCADFEDRGEDAFGKWIAGIAEMKARRAIQWHAGAAKRASAREVTRGHRPDTAQFAAQGPSPSEAAIGAETAAFARRAMDSLPEHYREILRLVRDEHLTFKKAGERMGRSEEAARKLYGRALANLTEEFNRLRGVSDA